MMINIDQSMDIWVPDSKANPLKHVEKLQDGLEDCLGVASPGVFASVALPTPEGGMSESLD